MPPKKGAPPGGSGTPSQKIAAVNSDTSDHSLSIPVCQLLPRPVRPNELPELRRLWWAHAREGHRLPAELEIILIEGGAS